MGFERNEQHAVQFFGVTQGTAMLFSVLSIDVLVALCTYIYICMHIYIYI